MTQLYTVNITYAHNSGESRERISGVAGLTITPTEITAHYDETSSLVAMTWPNPGNIVRVEMVLED